MKKTLRAFICLLCLAASGAAVLAGVAGRLARADGQGPAGNLTQDEAFRLLRTINTVEANIFSRTESYVPLAQILDELGTRPDIKLADSSMGTLKGYSVSVVVSADGKHYISAIVPVSSACGFSAFSRGEMAVIHVGTQLGCPGALF